MRKKLFLMLGIIGVSAMAWAQQSNIPETARQETIQYLSQRSSIPKHIIERGVQQAASFWTEKDGTATEFTRFCKEHFCKDLNEKTALFERLCQDFEIIYGHKQGEELALPFDVVANILKTVEYVMFLIYIIKGNKMLKNSKTA